MAGAMLFMADLDSCFRYTMAFEDPSLEGRRVADPTAADLTAVARFGVNSAAHPEALSDGFYGMNPGDALAYARKIFEADYFTPIGGLGIVDDGIAKKYCDLAYNAGVREATLIAQRAANRIGRQVGLEPIAEDGEPGPATRLALNAVNAHDLLTAMMTSAHAFYTTWASNIPRRLAELPALIRRVNTPA